MSWLGLGVTSEATFGINTCQIVLQVFHRVFFVMYMGDNEKYEWYLSLLKGVFTQGITMDASCEVLGSFQPRAPQHWRLVSLVGSSINDDVLVLPSVLKDSNSTPLVLICFLNSAGTSVWKAGIILPCVLQEGKLDRPAVAAVSAGSTKLFFLFLFWIFCLKASSFNVRTRWRWKWEFGETLQSEKVWNKLWAEKRYTAACCCCCCFAPCLKWSQE